MSLTHWGLGLGSRVSFESPTGKDNPKKDLKGHLTKSKSVEFVDATDLGAPVPTQLESTTGRDDPEKGLKIHMSKRKSVGHIDVTDPDSGVSHDSTTGREIFEKDSPPSISKRNSVVTFTDVTGAKDDPFRTPTPSSILDSKENPFRTPSLRSINPCASSSSSVIPSAKKESDEKNATSIDVRELPDDEEEYAIEQIADRDDIEHMEGYKRTLIRLTPLLAFLSTVAFWVYFTLRVICTIGAEKLGGKIFAMAWVFIAVELGIAGPMILHRFWQVLGVNSRKRPKLRLEGSTAPSVDVVITCCGEDDDLVLDTAKAACDVDYPVDRFRVIIFDDGKSEGLRQAIERAAASQFPNMHYRSRPKYPGVPHHFKAGNLNYALEETKQIPGGQSTYFAALDADMIPEKLWLKALLPHLIRDKNCAMSCPPQLFYNVPPDDPLSQCLDLFVHISEPIKDAMGVAWCTGSGYILRRVAIDSIGGFPIGSLAEDVCCSSMLLGKGWNTVFVHEPLQWGTVPDSYTSHLKQRTRWTIGTIQTALKLRFSLFGPLVSKMTFYQRLCGFVYTVSALCTIFLVMSMMTVPIVLISGGNLIPFTDYNQLRWLIRTCFAQLFISRLEEKVLYLSCGYRVGQRDQRAMLWMAPYHALSVVQSFLLPKWLGGKIAVFTSSGSQKCELNERDARRRAPLHRRLKVIIWDCKGWMHLAYIMFILVAVIRSTVKVVQDEANQSVEHRFVAMLTHAGWPPLLWVLGVISCWAPIHYAFFPPSMPDRQDLLVRDEKTGVAHPTEEAKKVKSTWSHWMFEFLNSLITLYTTFIFVCSFLF